jgi:hypothetical protein
MENTPEETYFLDIYNQTPWTLVANVEFNSDLKDWYLWQPGPEIRSQNNHCFKIASHGDKFPSKKRHRVYAYKLTLSISGKKERTYFSNPLGNPQKNSTIIVKNDETTQDFRLIIENKQ